MSGDDRLPFRRRHLPDDLGRALRRVREEGGRSRVAVADAVGIGPRTLARIERGSQKPSWPTLDRLCDVLDVSVTAVAPRWFADSLDVPERAVVAPGVGLRVVRRSRGLTLARLSELSGVSVATLSRHERGLTASRRLGGSDGARVGAGEEDGYDLLADALGFVDGAALREACLAAAP